MEHSEDNLNGERHLISYISTKQNDDTDAFDEPEQNSGIFRSFADHFEPWVMGIGLIAVYNHA